MGRGYGVQERKAQGTQGLKTHPGPGFPPSLSMGPGLVRSASDLNDPGYQRGAEGGDNKVFLALNKCMSLPKANVQGVS